MKLNYRLLAPLLFISVITACNDNSGENAEAAPTTPGVQNVNGNIPDSTTSITLNQPLPVDSTYADSTKK